MRVERFEGPATKWDGFVRGHRSWTHFHLWGWQEVVERAFGHETAYLAARTASGEIAGILPLVWVRSRLFGRFLVSMPFLNYGGPIGSPEASKALIDASMGLVGDDDGALLELRCRHPVDTDLPMSMRKITVVLDLPTTPDDLWGRLPSKVRSQVRRPRKEGMTVTFGLEQLPLFYDVFSMHMRDLGTPVLPRHFFELIADEFPDSVSFACVYLENRPIAAGCGFSWAGETEITWASALRSHSRLAPNMLLYWGFMEHAIEKGCETFNFGRCSPGGGTHRFKKQWGGRDEPLFWYHSASGGRKTPSPDDGAFAWGPRLWSRLPLPLTNRLGPSIVKYIP